jgi:hypothetical protein
MSAEDGRTSRTARIWQDDEGIIHMVALGVESSDDTVGETMELLADLVAGTPAPIFFDARNWPSGDAPSWARFISRIESVCSAGAVLVDPENPPRLGKYPSLLDALVIPFRVFTDETEAMAFLHTHNS